MKIWMVTKIVVGALFLVLALFLGCLVFLRGREIHGYRKTILLELPVDLSKRGSSYRGTVNHIWDGCAHGVTLRVDTPKGYSSIEGAQHALKGAELQVKWMTPGNGKPIEYVADNHWMTAFQKDQHHYSPALFEDRHVHEAGSYELTMNVLKPAQNLRGVPQTLVAFYEVCGVELLPQYFFSVVALLFGLVGLLILGPAIYHFGTGPKERETESY